MMANKNRTEPQRDQDNSSTFEWRVQSRHLKMLQESRKNTNKSQGEGSHYHVQQNQQKQTAARTSAPKPARKNRNNVKLDPVSTPSAVKVSQYISANHSLYQQSSAKPAHSNASQVAESGGIPDSQDAGQSRMSRDGAGKDEN